MKALIGDKVAVMKVHADTDTKFMAMAGVLVALDRGRKTGDKRAHGEEGECPAEMEQAAKGWAIVELDDGKRFSVSTKEMVVHTQKVVLEHNATMHQAQQVVASRKVRAEALEEARSFCTAKGLDVETLTDENLLKLRELLSA